jgi:hypothetical protein
MKGMREIHLGRYPTDMDRVRIKTEKVKEIAIWGVIFGGAFLGITRFLETHPEIMEIVKKLPSSVR